MVWIINFYNYYCIIKMYKNMDDYKNFLKEIVKKC